MDCSILSFVPKRDGSYLIAVGGEPYGHVSGWGHSWKASNRVKSAKGRSPRAAAIALLIACEWAVIGPVVMAAAAAAEKECSEFVRSWLAEREKAVDVELVAAKAARSARAAERLAMA